MNRFVMRATVLAALGLCQPVFADEISDLKAEIAAQKAAAQAQQARLEALEQKLNGVVQQQQAAAAKPAPAAPASGGASYSAGEGLSYVTANGSVTLYGLIDISYVHTDHANAAGASVNAPRVAWFSGNRWGITGTRAMADSGLNAIFRLESEYESQTGNMDTPGTLFNRDAWAGVQSASFGKLTLGRQNAIARDPSGSAIYGDPYGPAAPSTEEGGYTNNNNFKQLIFYAGSAGGTRMSNSVVWKKAFDGGLVAGLAYQFGGIPGNPSNGTTESVTLAYGGGAFNVAGYATTAKVGNLSDNSYSVGGNYTFGMIRVNAGVFRYTGEQGALGNRSDNAYTVSAKVTPGGKIDYQIGYQDMKANRAAVNGGGNVLNAFADASAAHATATGSRSTMYASAFYHFDKNTEVYIAGDYLKLKDGYKFSATNGFPSQTEFAVGLRTRF
jgi:predicted porin